MAYSYKGRKNFYFAFNKIFSHIYYEDKKKLKPKI